MKETLQQDKLQLALREHNVYARSLVGNMLQSGLPDMLVISAGGYLFHIENKVWRKTSPPLGRDDFVSLLKGPQRRIITEEFWGRGVYCPILAFHETFKDYAWLYDNLNDAVAYNRWMEFVEYFAALKKS